ncbi:MAG: aminotransferase class I/II-fold pyridoxal phosphate-dependent enzyme, partial [Chitinophagaceae bacterium]
MQGLQANVTNIHLFPDNDGRKNGTCTNNIKPKLNNMAPMNRRNWLKASTLLTGGLALAPAAWNKLEAAPANRIAGGERFISDAELLGDAPVLKARLSANENPFGPSEKAKLAITGAMAASYQYGFMGNRQLVQKIAAREKVDPDMVLLGAGSTPILHATAIHYSRNGGNIVTADPSYADLPEHATNFNTKWVKVPLTAEYKLDLDAIEKAIDAETKLVCICNPNNP